MVQLFHDGQCAELVSWYIHLLDADARSELHQLATIPLLPPHRHWHHWHRSGINLTQSGGDAIILEKLVADAEKNCYIAYGEIIVHLGFRPIYILPRVKFRYHNSPWLWGGGRPRAIPSGF